MLKHGNEDIEGGDDDKDVNVVKQFTLVLG